LAWRPSGRDGCQSREQITLLREYRTRLIAGVVTGKLDVREAAAALPEETEVAAPLEAIDDERHWDGEAALGEFEAEADVEEHSA
jgi:type I restriction enzyme, S subunit